MRNNPEYPPLLYQQMPLSRTTQSYNREFSNPIASFNQQSFPIRKNVIMQQAPQFMPKNQPQTIVLFKYNPPVSNFRSVDQNSIKIANTSINKATLSQNFVGKPIYPFQNKEKTQSSEHNSQKQQQLIRQHRIQILPPPKRMKQDLIQKGRAKSKTEVLKYEAILEERPEFQQSRHDRQEIISRKRQPVSLVENNVIQFESSKHQKEELSVLKTTLAQLQSQNIKLKAQRQTNWNQEITALRRQLIEARSQNNQLRTEIMNLDSHPKQMEQKQRTKQIELIQQIKALKIDLQKSQNERMMAQVSEAELQKKLKKILQDNDKKQSEIIRLKKLAEGDKTQRNIRYHEYTGNNP